MTIKMTLEQALEKLNLLDLEIDTYYI